MRALKDDLKAAKIALETEAGRIDFHGLRHSCATNLARAGVPPQHLQAFMRHSTFQVTSAYYVHLGAEDVRSAIETVTPAVTQSAPNCDQRGSTKANTAG